MLNVLLVEDDTDLAATIVDYLELEAINCDHASDGVSGLSLIETNAYQVIILDINLPRMDGLTVCKNMRNQGMDTPVLMLTARDSIDDKVVGFSSGTDDYLVKPFALEELVVRLQALARRRSGQVNLLKVANIELNLDQQQVKRGDTLIRLSPIGLKLLETLMRVSPNTVSRTELMRAVWGDEHPDSNSLKVHMHNLRKAIDTEERQSLIQTITGFGFAMRAKDEH